MSDEQQPHRPEPGSGWQPMPHGPEYDAEATGFLQLPPDHSHQDPAAHTGGWDPLAAPGTGYTPPPVTGGPGAPSQGGQWQPTAHGPGAPADPSGTGHWAVPMASGADDSGQWVQPGPGGDPAGGSGDSGEYAYGEHQDPHGSHDPHGPHTTAQWHLPGAGQHPGQPGQPGQTAQWSIPFAADEGVDETGVYQVNDPAAAAQWQVPESPGGQWTVPAAGDEGVDETGAYPIDDRTGPATRPYGAHDTAQWTMPFADGAPEQQGPHQDQRPHHDQRQGRPEQPGQPGQQHGQPGQWSIPVAGDDAAAEDSGEYVLGDHAVRGGPAAPTQTGRGPARRRLRLPGGADVPVEHSGVPTPPHGSAASGALSTPAAGTEVPEVDDWPEELTHGGQGGPAGADGHAGQATPPHGVAPVGARGGFMDDGYDGHDGPVGAEGHAAQATPPHGVVAEAEGLVPEALEAAEVPQAPQAPTDPVQAGESAELALDGHGASLPGAGVETDPSVEDVEGAADAEPADGEEQPTAAADLADTADADAQADPDTALDTDPDTALDTAPQADSEHPSASYVLHVNGTDRPVTDAWIGESLLYVLRERLGLAGAKDGCSQGECGACSVQVDGRLVASCLVPAATAAGCEVRTIEGLAVDGQPSDVQRALAACGAVQCGFCVPGMAMTVHDLLEGNHSPTDLQTRQAISGNLCRCSGYRGVVGAVREVVAGREAAAAAAAEEDAAPDGGQDAAARIPHQAGPPGMNGTGDGGFDGSGTGSGRATA
ncbi:2Fe-2S iron-sulfur cluster-binding protein [Streptomyces sp. ME19-01-6]|uniref:2Fe-2S iron-sulfur cluster-binding protein n=1 Tax=Streptomyces sp. ME19-01-6 TaxID=3028686 RepID=UPI0029B5DF67|nr:2Fe-2S iron-sulfur cluster-binding protein [Streptomyces sp. ME19-01-6]MDX3232791.1 2Fe-2S iron-sulfur cluster-binding protein [Streptomyces sp. ME19-01-6]